jgi:hypothetical protein
MKRAWFTEEIVAAIRRSPVVALLGPRQSGKTTLARQVARSGVFPCDEGVNYFDLEDPASR